MCLVSMGGMLLSSAILCSRYLLILCLPAAVVSDFESFNGVL